MPENQMPDFSRITHELMDDLVTFASVTGVNFFKESFDKQGFTDEAFEAWPHRRTGDDGRGILMNTANLRDSTQVLERSLQQIVFGNTAVYADIHNSGGTIRIKVTDRSRKYFWKMYYANADKQGNITAGGSAIAASMWKAMALTRKTYISVRIPKRQFIGESKVLLGIIDHWMTGQIVNRFNNL